MKQIIECVPNFSEGKNQHTILQIAETIKQNKEVKLLGIDKGQATNRSVFTFVGSPESIVDTAFQAIKKAAELIDMRLHKGVHPRMGATDICPLVPYENITMEETIVYARQLAERVGNELQIPIYCYGNAAFNDKKKDLANIRSGQYEGLEKKLSNTEWKPDFGSKEFNEQVKKTGATAIGARDFLVAFNVNIHTTEQSIAEEIATEIREKGKAIKDDKGNKIYTPGTLKGCKAIGWYIEEYGLAQVSMNLTDLTATPVHIAFEEVKRKAKEKNVVVNGSELIGLMPIHSILEAGKFYRQKQNLDINVSNEQLIKTAISAMGLDSVHPFNPQKKILEYAFVNYEL